MRLSQSKSKNSTSLYVIKTVLENGKRTTKVVEKLGTVAELQSRLNGQDPIEWAKEYVAKLNQEEAQGNRKIQASFSATEQIPMGKTNLYNAGYLFLQAIYYGLNLDKICCQIRKRHDFQYDLSAILSRLIYTRILYPSSKVSSFESSRKFIEPPRFELHQIYRALDVIAVESDYIEEQVYKSSLRLVKRDTSVLYYDCTNYFFETEQEDGIRQYGLSKEHRPNPIVQMGLFMDGSGIPLAMSIQGGACNEQPSLKPIEERIEQDFSLSRFIVCTDAGLASMENRLMNNTGNRRFVVTQSLKTMKGFLIQWALDPSGWRIAGDETIYRLDEIDDSSENKHIYYKQRWINENGLEQRLLVTYSPKYKAYQREVRQRQIARAKRMVDKPASSKRKNPNDPARFVTTEHCTTDGELAKQELTSLNQTAIAKEEAFDGFYGVCTNLEDQVSVILQINKGRWEIEESFRILKSEFRARPVYLSRENRIKAHFTTCFLSLLIFRILEVKLGFRFTADNIVHTLRDMYLFPLQDEGFLPAFTRTPLTDALHETFAFPLDTQIVSKNSMLDIRKASKNSMILRSFP